MRPRWRDETLAAGAVAAALLGAPRAALAVDCSALPAPVYGLGGSAQKPLLARVAARLAALASPQTVVYQAPGACLGINALINDTRITGEASYWTAAGVEQRCTLPIAGGQRVDFANMGNEATSCPGIAQPPAGIGDFTGPVTTWNLIVPVGSSQQSISAEAAYFVYGLGAEGRVAPWTDEASIFRRDENSAVQLFVALATGVPVGRFHGRDTLTNAGSVTALAMAVNPEAAIGFASGETADANRASVRTLAYQHVGQRCGYWPDATATSFDKRNVRNGQYYLWSATHFFARLDASGHIADPAVARFVGYFTGEVAPPPELPLLDLEIANGNVPRCAMNVWRQHDLGPMVSYQPAEPCGCYFERVATGATTCTACTESSGCPAAAPACRRGYCEVR